jgi:hypothetical protein
VRRRSVVDLLVTLSELALAAGDRVRELEINPRRVGPDGVSALHMPLVTADAPEEAAHNTNQRNP